MSSRKKARSTAKKPQNPIECGRFRLDPETRRLTKDGREMRLTPKETQLLAALMAHKEQTLTRKFLMKRVWNTDFLDDTRTLDVHIHWVRQKIEDDPRHPVYITTVRRVGYRFSLEKPLSQQSDGALA